MCCSKGGHAAEPVAPGGPTVNRQPDLPLAIDVQKTEDHAVITPVGYLNALTGDQIDKVCDKLLAERINYIIINFSKVEVINTIGISILVGIFEKVVSRQGIVYLTHLAGANREIFDVLGLSSVAMLFDSDAAACEHLRRDKETLKRAMGE
jgi:anti-anti-sigma factor